METFTLKPKEMSKKDRVLQHIQSRGRVRTSDVIRFGTMIYSNRALRDAQDLVQHGKIWRMREDLKLRYFGEIKEDVFTADKNEA